MRPILTFYLGLAYIAVSLASAIVLFTDMVNVRAQRNVVRFSFVLGALLFLPATRTLNVGLVPELIVWAWVICVLAIGYAKIRFCSVCGRTALAGLFQASARYCSRCGASLLPAVEDRASK